MNAEENEPTTSAKSREAGPSMLSRIVSVLFPARPRAYAAIAAVLVVLVPAVAIFSVVTKNEQTGQYQTASQDAEPAIAMKRMLVKFNSEVAWADIDAFLRENRVQIIQGPTADGIYELEFEETGDLAEEMGAETTIFEFALPAN